MWSAPRRRASASLPGERVEQRHVGTQRLGELQRHVAEPAEADDGHLAVLADVPVAERRPGGDTGAQQRRGADEVEAIGAPSARSARSPPSFRNSRHR